MSFFARLPHLRNERRPVREIGIHSQDVRRLGGSKSGKQGATISASFWFSTRAPRDFRSFARTVLRAPVNYDDLGVHADGLQHIPQRWQQQLQVFAFIGCEDDDTEVGICNSQSDSAGLLVKTGTILLSLCAGKDGVIGNRRQAAEQSPREPGL